MPIKPYCLLILTAAISTSIPVTTGHATKIKTYREMSCLSIGGICILSNDCPKGKQAPGLCPQQQQSGVDCCFALPISETRCEKNGGECKDKTIQCPDNLTFARATDCGPDEKCCILVD